MRTNLILNSLLKNSFEHKKVTNFTLETIKREDIVNYPDDINFAFETDLGYGGYLEKRSFYKDEKHVIHTGIDLFVKYKQEIFAPFNGLITDIAFTGPEEYKVGNGTGYQIIMWHTFDQVRDVLGITKTNKIFKGKKYLKIIYIHLDNTFIEKNNHHIKSKNNNGYIRRHLSLSKSICKDQKLAKVGSRYNNGGWAPHIHIETFIRDEIEQIYFDDVDDFDNKVAIGVTTSDKIAILKKKNIIDPDLVFGFSNIKNINQKMTLENIKRRKNIISIKDLDVTYNKKNHVIKKISFDVKHNEIISILGPSGCGKTTLLNAICNFIKYSGEIKIKNIVDSSDIGYVFQDNLLYDNQTVFNNIVLGAKYNKKFLFNSYIIRWEKIELNDEDKSELLNIKSLMKLFLTKVIAKNIFVRRFNKFKKLVHNKYEKINFKKMLHDDVRQIMKILGIDKLANYKPRDISGGQKQRVSIAKAIIKKPIILVMDEPLSSLDARIKNDTREWIKDIQKLFNITLLFVTHDQKEAMLLSDKILLLFNGEIMQYASPKVMFNEPNNEFSARFIGWPEINLIKDTKTKRHFIRPNDINIKRAKTGTYTIDKKEINGHEFIYYVKTNKTGLNIISSKDLLINEKINISWDKKNEFFFEAKQWIKK
ncbi:ATP-binding cassette domain-containing protein [Candidatus Mycoplasma mahonii]|uniref:ATP-binding cassette domain-containing protein n=1 Tax=Candidatus Mycoplasma mahonii TaxID=3004105 RepID=UPI0026EB8BB1|nr:ATP-binding cassette domain-containing protein [Candidatus Mycoplasma mahonii]WKX02178.1 ATP-binding cassette domain-containing protein [Candidatus Mycoplasma mahonii]